MALNLDVSSLEITATVAGQLMHIVEESDQQAVVSDWCEKHSLRAGFEPAREDPIGFQVQRLNHSAITASVMLLTQYRV